MLFDTFVKKEKDRAGKRREKWNTKRWHCIVCKKKRRKYGEKDKRQRNRVARFLRIHITYRKALTNIVLLVQNYCGECPCQA
jgi:hypothetical protein